MLRNKRVVSPYRQFSIEEWAELGLSTPLPLTEQELAELRGINERVSLDEVSQVYLPISRLLSFHVASTQELNIGIRQFLEIDAGKVPYIIGIAGSVAVGNFQRVLIEPDCCSFFRMLKVASGI